MKKEKEEKRGIGKKHIIIFLVGVLLISGAVSYAYFTGITRTTGTGEVTTSTTVVNANTTLTTEGTLEFNDSDIYPGHKNISTIKVTATGKDEVDYNVIWTGTNSFTTTLNYYVYKTTTEESPSITCNKTTGLVDNMTTYYEVCTNNGFDNLGSIVASGEIPTLTESTKIELIKVENIQATEEGNSVYYHVVIEYPNKEEGQNADFNKSINGEVGVEVAEKKTVEQVIATYNIATMPSITGISTDTSNTLYTVADDDGTSYVFRGNPSNNWVQFGGFYWRIIRVNGDGSIRMIYNGTSTETKGTGTQIGDYAYNSTINDNAYVGFMYGSAGASSYTAAHANTNNSNVKAQLDSWYSSSGLKNYAEYIDTNAGFCNDRQVGTTTESGYGTTGYGMNKTVYAPFNRFKTQDGNFWKTTQIPSLKCTNTSSDLFTIINSNKGNKKLTNPVGLITIDEVVFAGGFGGATNDSYYLYNGEDCWTMSPYYFNGSIASMFSMYSSGDLYGAAAYGMFGIRPVINLRSDVTLIGDGTSENAYRIS